MSQSRFNKQFVVNFLIGKEFFFRKNRILGLNTRINYMGGERYSPVLMAQSIQKKDVVYDDSRAFEKSAPATNYVDFTVTWRTNKKSHSSVWALQVKNVLGASGFEGFSYYPKENTIKREEFVIILPVLSYKIEF